ncbi:MAG: hypothetical protein ACJAZO_005029 [Myxococcota bacterium]
MLSATFLALALASEPAEGDWDAGSDLVALTSSIRVEVDDYVSTVGMFKRPFARRPLIRATLPCAKVGIHDTSHGLAISCDDRPVAVAAPNGEPVEHTGHDGRALDLIHTIDSDGAILQTFTNRRGTRVNRFVALEDGGLRLEVTITSGLLDGALRYDVLYQP